MFEIKLNKKFNFHIVHCRSYISALVGLAMKKQFGTKFIFDMRGFWADERIEGGIWKLSHPLYRLIYKFIKKQEKQRVERERNPKAETKSPHELGPGCDSQQAASSLDSSAPCLLNIFR